MGGLGRKFLHKLPDMGNLRNLESPFILWIQIDIYFLASTNYKSVYTDPGTYLYFITATEDNQFEGQHFDRKEAARVDASGVMSRNNFKKLKDQVERTMSGFANADGGVLILGVSKTGHVTGLDHLSEEQIIGILDMSSMTGAVIQPKLHPVTAGENTRKVALFCVDASQRSVCYRIKDGATWIRKGLSTQSLRGPELEQFEA